MQHSDVYYQLLSEHVSGIIMPIFRKTKIVLLHVYCWMWLIAVVGRCVVGCEHCAEPEQYTTCSNTVFVLLKMGIMMPETF